MQKVKIPKKTKGQFRTIYKPSKEEKEALRAIIPSILEKALNACVPGVCMGFFPNTSPVMNALCHRNYKYTTIFDLSDFFDSINTSHLVGKLSDTELALVLVDGAPRQGLPTSPIVANLAASDMDKAILSFIREDVKYTRYADDLCFSYSDWKYNEHIIKNIPVIISNCGFKVNEKKTRTMSNSNGRRMITGIAVDKDIHPSRRVKRKIRAALHNGNMNKYNGLKEWSLLKRPKALVRAEIEALKQDFKKDLDLWASLK